MIVTGISWFVLADKLTDIYLLMHFGYYPHRMITP
jgi:hypothetical protein